MTATGSALQTRGLTAGYPAVTALEEISIDVPYGVTVAVLGPNGSGKSSLFAAAVGLLKPTAGTVEVGDGGVAWMPQMHQSDHALPLTVFDVAMMGRWGSGRWFRRMQAGDRERVEAAIESLDLGAVRDRRLDELSGGQRQRALLAQVMVQDAGLILLDEPLTGVDRPTAAGIAEQIGHWRDEGRSVMVATHDLDSAAHDYDLVLALNRHQVAFGSADVVCTEEVMRETFSGHVTRLESGEIVDTSHRHEGAS